MCGHSETANFPHTSHKLTVDCCFELKIGCSNDRKVSVKVSHFIRFLTDLKLQFQDKNWEICDSIKSRIEQFKRTMPLIQDLKNPAMRERHWAQIKSEVQKPFDQNGEYLPFFNLLFKI